MTSVSSPRSGFAIRSVFLLFGSWVVAVAFALAGFLLLRGPESYPQLVVGTLAWGAESKRGELAAALIFIIALAVAWLALQRASKQYFVVDDGAATATLQLACAPGAIWLAQTLFRPGDAIDWLFVSVFLLGWWAVGAAAATSSALSDSRWRSVHSLHALPFMLLPVLAGFSAVGALVFLNRTLLIDYPVPAFLTGFCCAGAAILIISRAARRRSGSGELEWNRGIALSQLGIPLLAAALIPTPIARAGVLEHATASLSLLASISMLVAALVLWDIRRCASDKTPGGLLKSVSPLALLLCLFILKSPATGIPVVATDDWHSGEWLIPWISWRDFGLLPYADVMPVRGFISAADAALSQALLSGTVADLTHLRPARNLLYSAIVFFSMRYAAGTWAALIAVAVLDFTSPLGQIDCFFIAGICIQAGLTLRDRLLGASLAWMYSSLVLFVLAPGQGVLYAIATSPLMSYAVFHMTRAARRWAIGTALVTGTAVTLGVLAVPTLTQIAWGIAFYFADNVTVNTVANGIPWESSFDSGSGALALELFRSFCLIAAATACLTGLTLYKKGRTCCANSADSNSDVRYHQLGIVLCAVVVLTVLMFLPRVLGRIDAGNPSRIGPLTLLILGLAPLIWVRRLDLTTRVCAAVFSIFLAAGLQGSGFLSAGALLMPRQSNDSDGMIDAASVGLSNIGLARFDPAHLDRLTRLNRVLNDILPAGTPYYDLTNRNAHYVYFSRPVPTKWSSPYYLSDERAQVRTANELEARRVPLLLLAASNITHDGGTVALRAYWLYRFVLAEYVPFKRDGYIFAVRRDLADTPGFVNFVQASASTVDIFEEVFGVSDLKSIPRAWGHSSTELEKALSADAQPVQLVEVGNEHTKLDAQLSQAERKNLPSFDLLRLRMECAAEGAIRLVWTARHLDAISSHSLNFSAGSGTLLIPVGSRPAWTLAAEVTEVNLDHGTTRCKVRGAEWLRRSKPAVDHRLTKPQSVDTLEPRQAEPQTRRLMSPGRK